MLSPATTPALLRLFTVFWWLVVLGSLVAAYLIITEPTNWFLIEAQWFFRIEVPIQKLFHLWPEPDPPPLPTSTRLNQDELRMVMRAIEETAVEVARDLRALQLSLLACILPYVVLTISRWIVTGRWRLGPRW